VKTSGGHLPSARERFVFLLSDFGKSSFGERIE